MTLRQVNGRTVTSEKVRRNNSKTFAQMRRRVQWANLVNLWRSFEGDMRPSFESRPAGVSDFNMFVSANICTVPVYLEHAEAQQGATVVAPYQVTRGSLPSVDVSASGVSGEVGTDISLGSLSIGEETTVAQFSDAVVQNNEDFAYGDQISAFVVRQETNSSTNVPYVKVQRYEITLDHEDSETLLSDIDPDGLVFAKQGSSDKLGMNQTVNGGVVYIHSRKGAGRTLVSTQRLVVANTILSRYQTDAKLTAAILSYGGKLTADFLVPNVDEAPEVA